MPEKYTDTTGNMSAYQSGRIDLRSDAAQEIISLNGGFLTRWALWVFLSIMIVIIVSAWFIKYPEVIEARATITAINAPKEIFPGQDGQLVRLLVANDQQLDAGQTIGWMESTAAHDEIISLSTLLNNATALLSDGATEKVSALFNKPVYHLGELQPSYQQFIAAWQQFNDCLINGYYYRRKRVLYADYEYLRKVYQTLEKQKALTQLDVDLATESFKAFDSLYKDKVISGQDFRDQKSRLVNKQMSIPQLESSLLQNENQQSDKRKEIEELEHTILQQKIIFEQALQTLKSIVDEWIRKYVIKAPIAGKMVFVMSLEENKFLQAGKIIGYVNPDNTNYYAQVMLSQFNFGKVDTGQKVQLRIDAYPYQEFGIVEGKLQHISRVPSDSGFLSTIQLSKGLVTNYNKEIQYRNGLKSNALIIIKDVRLIQRLYYNIIKGINN